MRLRATLFAVGRSHGKSQGGSRRCGEHQFHCIPRLIETAKKSVAELLEIDSSWNMIRAGFLSPPDRAALVALMRNGSAAHRLTRRANAMLLLDDGLSCEEVAKVLYLDDDTVRGWAK